MSITRIKFCGITREQDADYAISLGAWAVGMILWPGSARAVNLEQASAVAAVLRRRAEIVGVFVNPTLDEVARAADVIGLTMLQFHGDEGPAFCAEAARRTGCRVIKAARVREGADIQALSAFHTDFHLLDSYTAGIPGGTGETFNWDLAAQHRRFAPSLRKGERVPVLLSGGLTPENVADAISAVHPYAVDVASGIELEPGIKIPERMRAFADAVAAMNAEAAPDASAAGEAGPGESPGEAPLPLRAATGDSPGPDDAQPASTATPSGSADAQPGHEAA